jgi:glycosyltransferase involved in cell wall biosynthesis
MYKYEEGLGRILKNLSDLPEMLLSSIEIVISDDSDKRLDERLLRRYPNLSQSIIYNYNNPKKGACRNWNELIEYARGEYFILMHHDEFPFTQNFIGEIFKEINLQPKVDLFVMDCLLMNKKNKTIIRHVPNWIRSMVLKRFPSYLFYRNVVGPSASLIVKKKIGVMFDCELKWLIDVDQYYRLLRKADSVKIIPNIKIGSYVDRESSITSGLGNNIKQIEKTEKQYLAKKYFSELNAFSNNGVWSIAEKLVWGGLRICTRTASRILNKLGVYPIPKAKAEELFNDLV